MERITIGLDFGTHQTKVCVENKTDVNNPVYSFFPFKDLNGENNIILPSVIQINKDNTLSYGFINKDVCKYGKKFFIGSAPKYPQRPNVPEPENIPAPVKPQILNVQTPSAFDGNMDKFKTQYARANKSYKTQMSIWEQRQKDNKEKLERQIQELEVTYINELKEWYRWQNFSQTNYRMIYRYFKQSTFSDYKWNCSISSSLLSVWFLSFVLFQLEKVYGNNFAIQMGIPTGSDNFERKKKKAVSILLTAYHLVEDVFQNDMEKFLSTTVDELEEMTTFIPYSEAKKQEFGLLVFPEAFAALKSLTHQKKIEPGMSLMVDIGGGTTDISFFTVEDNMPKIYDYSSIPYALNYIIETARPNMLEDFDPSIDFYDANMSSLTNGIESYFHKLVIECESLIKRLIKAFEKTGYPIHKLKDALKNRIIIYSGGGSSLDQLRAPVGYFSDIKHINPNVWKGMTIEDVDKYASICPIISTSLGLAISEISDEVQMSTPEEMFHHLEGTHFVEERGKPQWV